MAERSVEQILEDLPQSRESFEQVWAWLRAQEPAGDTGDQTDDDQRSVISKVTEKDGGEHLNRSTREQRKRRAPGEDDSDLSNDPGGKGTKRRKTDSSSEGSSTLGSFERSSLVKSRDGTFKTPKPMRKYLERHLRRCLSKEEREALFKEHLKPDLPVCAPPKVDRFVSDFLGKKLPRERDQEFSKIQAAVLACIRPLGSAWQQLLENGLAKDQEMKVPATEVLTLIQCTLCMVGNASEQISQIRRARILEAADKSWAKFAKTDVTPEDGLLFGDDFRSKLTKDVENDSSLGKALSITKRNQRPADSFSSSRRTGQPGGRFFRRSPPTAYGSGRGKSTYLYNTHPPYKKAGEYSRGSFTPSFHRPGQNPRFHEPKIPPSFGKTQQKKL